MKEKPVRFVDPMKGNTASAQIEKPPRAEDPAVVPDEAVPINKFGNMVDTLLNYRPVPLPNFDMRESGPRFLQKNPLRQHRYLTGSMRAGVTVNQVTVRYI